MARVGITGHRSLPIALAQQISTLLRAELDAFDPAELIGVTSLADGADTLFADEVLSRGGALDVIVPALEYRGSLPATHHADYDRIIAQATTVHQLSFVKPDPEAHMAASMLLLAGVGQLLAIWDGQPSRGYGGTADVVAAAQKRGINVRVVWPNGAVR
jgi:hypothetical protein